MDNSGSAFPKRNRETRPDCTMCGEKSYKKNLCKKHYRFSQMKYTSKYKKQYSPSYVELEALLPDDMKCPECKREMVFSSWENGSRVISIQHYRSGLVSIICKSCNTRHAKMEGDSFSDIPKDCKKCPRCSLIMPYESFVPDKSRTKNGDINVSSLCRECLRTKRKQWAIDNKDKYNEYQRNRRLKIKENINA